MLPNEYEIDNNKWYYYKYMKPSYSDKIIHLYSAGTIGNGSHKMCVYCQMKGHVKSECSRDKNIQFNHNF